MISDYIPHGVVVAFTTIVGFVARDHMKRDDARFAEVKADYDRISDKLDAQNERAADNHAELLKLLIK